MKNYLLTLAILLVSSFQVWAQQSDVPTWEKPFNAYLAVQTGIPLEEFAEASPNAVGVGGSLGLLFGLGKQSPWLAGLDVSYLNYGKEKNTLNKNTPDEIRIKTTNNIWSFHGVLRFRPKVTGPIRPYFDGMVGTKVFNTVTKINYDIIDTILDDSEEEQLESFNDATFSYGGGVGINIRMGKVLLDLRTVYLYGSKAEYVEKGSAFITPDNTISYTKQTSRTDMLLPHIGLIYVME